MSRKKSYREKLNEIQEKIHTITPEWEDRLGKGKILIPKATDIERIINCTEKGQLLTNNLIRELLAKEKNVRLTAAIPTGVCLKYIALAAEEERKMKDNITPYWRVLRPDGTLNQKFPMSLENQIKILESEGHIIEYVKRKKLPKVVNFEDSLLI